MSSKQIVSIIFNSILVFSQTLHAANLEIDTTAPVKNKASLIYAPNLVPIVNIVTPDANGLSHNKFKNYNVEKKGLILNNSNKVVNTQLSGFISRNPNITGNSASLILNEVTGTSKTLLKGYSEVAGVSANVIVANPNGISVNGGGFINTPKVTLTTGIPMFSSGLLQGFDISKGEILLEGAGLNVNSIDKVAIYAKALQINAKIYANNLNIVTGDNSISLDGTVTSKNTVGTGISIDSSLLGGIYANTIFFVSSDKGVGINLPPEVFAQNLLFLEADGKIVISKGVSENTIEIKSLSSSIDVKDNITANEIIIDAQIDINIDEKSVINASEKVNISARNSINNKGEISALDGTSKSTIKASFDIINSGLIGGYDVDMEAKNIYNTGALYTKNNLKVTSKTLDNQMMIRSNKDIELLVENTFNNSENGMVYADGRVKISANQAKEKINNVTNKGVIQSGKNIEITAKTLTNTANIPIIKNTSITSTKTVSKGGSNNYDVVTTQTQTQTVNVVGDPALILANEDIIIDVETLNNFYSLIASDRNIVLKATTVNNAGKIIVTTTTTTTKQFRNERYCSTDGPSGTCINHKHRAGYRGTFTKTETTKLPLPNYGIQAKESITGNVVTLNNISDQLEGSLEDAVILEKIDSIDVMETNSISLQKLNNFLNVNNKQIINILNNSKSIDALINEVLTEENLVTFKKGLSIFKDTLTLNIAADEATLSSLEAIIAHIKTIKKDDTVFQDLNNFEQAVSTLKINIDINKNNLTQFNTLNDSILILNDLTLKKDKLKVLHQNVKDIYTQNSQTLETINTQNYISSLSVDLESKSNILRNEVNKALDLKDNVEYKIISQNDGLYQTNTHHSLSLSTPVTSNANSDLILDSLTLPKGKYNLFLVNKASKHPYLVEANPLYVNYETFISSDYMLDKLNLNPQSILKRLGDAMYETRLVRNSVMRLSGKRYLEGYSSDLTQYRALMDNALSVQEDLELSFGIKLTKEQINKLNKNIVWLEEKEIQGEKVLVPQLYLSSKNITTYGTKILANNISLNIQNKLINNANIIAHNKLEIEAKKITNIDGTIQSSADMTLKASGDINNLSGTIKSGGDLFIHSEGNINNITIAQKKTNNYGQGKETRTLLANQAKIISDKNINIEAKNTIEIRNGIIKANENINLTSKEEDIKVTSLELKHEYNFNLNNGYNKGINIENRKSNIDGKNIIFSSKNLEIKSSDINAKENIILDVVKEVKILATNNLSNKDTKIESKNGFLGKKTTRDMIHKEEVVQSNLNAKNIVITSKEEGITLESVNLKADQNIIVDAKKDIKVMAKQYREGELHSTSKSSWGGLSKSASMDRNDALKLKSADIKAIANNIIFKSGDSIEVLASKLSALNGDLSLEAANDILIAAGKEMSQDEQWTKKSSFMKDFFKDGTLVSSQFDLKGKVTTTAKFSSLNSKNLYINSGKDTTVLGSDLNAYKNISIQTGGDYKHASVQEEFYEYEEHKKTKLKFNMKMAQQFAKGISKNIKNNAGKIGSMSSMMMGDTSIDIFEAEISKSKKSNKDSISRASNINSGNQVDINSQKNINIVASNINAAGDINLNAKEDINIKSGINHNENDKKSLYANVYVGLNSQGINFTADYETGKFKNYADKASGSSVNTNSNLNINSNNVLVEGSELNVGKDLNVKVKNNFEVKAATNKTGKYTKTFDFHSQSGGENGMELKDGKIVIEMGSATIDKLKRQVDETTKTSSNINVGKNINVESGNNILVEGSNINAGEDVSLSAKNNIEIKEAKEEIYEKSKEFHGKAVVSFEIKHQAIEIIKAISALKKAKSRVNQAKQDFKEYKSDLVKLQSQLVQLQKEYANKIPGITKADIEEFKDIIQDVKSDKNWYKASIKLAQASVVMQSLFLTQQIAGLAQSASSFAWGFDAGINLNIDTVLQKANIYASSSVASNINAKNIYLNADNTALVQGSNLNAKENINIEANEVNIVASRDKSSNNTDREHANLNFNYSVFAGFTMSAAYDRAKEKNAQTVYTNSNVQANNINVKTKEDMNVKGATIQADETINLDVGKDLNVVAVQNRQRGDSKSFGVNFSYSAGNGRAKTKAMSKTDSGSSGSFGVNMSNSKYRNKQTLDTSIVAKEVNVNVKNETYLQGATLASLDENGNDNNKLNLKTKVLKYEDLSNTSYQNSKSMGASVSLGNKKQKDGSSKLESSSSTFQYSNGLSLSKNKTLSTLGKGNIEVEDLENSSDLERLNTDVSNKTKEIYSVNRKKGDIDIKIDHRVFTKEGRAEIKEDIDRNILLGEALSEVATKKSVSIVGDNANGQTNILEHIQNKQDFYSAAKNFYNDPKNSTQRDILANPDKYTPQQRQEANQAMIYHIASATGTKPSEVVNMLNDELKGFYSHEDGKIYISDNANENSKDTAFTVAHEASHAKDAQENGTENKSKTYEVNREEYANIVADDFVSKLDNDYASSGYDLSKATHQNSNTQVNSDLNKPTQIDKSLEDNTETFNQLNKDKGDKIGGGRSFTRLDAMELTVQGLQEKGKYLEALDVKQAYKLGELINRGNKEELLEYVQKNNVSEKVLEKAVKNAHHTKGMIDDTLTFYSSVLDITSLGETAVAVVFIKELVKKLGIKKAVELIGKNTLLNFTDSLKLVNDVVKLKVSKVLNRVTDDTIAQITRTNGIKTTPKISLKQKEINSNYAKAKETNFRDKNGNYIHPDDKKNLHVIPGSIQETTLKKGDRLVRYVRKKDIKDNYKDKEYKLKGDTKGTYTTIKGQSWDSLSLSGKKSDYRVFEIEVLDDIPVTKSLTTPWYERGVGGGVQLQFKKPLSKFANKEKGIKLKIIKEI